jgi:AAA15 family ATPase/GTPase
VINRVELKNFGPIEQLDWQNLGKINLVIGNNGCGKSFLLKALYSAMRTIEEYKRGDNPDDAKEILASKLFWTFQAEKIGDLVTKPNKENLSFNLLFDHQKFSYGFDELSTKIINFLENEVSPPRLDNSIFVPAKEILSLHHLILKSREQDKLLGFDDTYLDLARALNQPIPFVVIPPQYYHDAIDFSDNNRILAFDDDYAPIRHPIIEETINHKFIEPRKLLDRMVGGVIEFDDVKKRWYFRKENQRFSIGITAEGIRKTAILSYLLRNKYLNEDSIIFIDEPESNLHPEAISKLLDIITILAKHGIQFFIASHSYFVIKKLFLIAQEQQMSIPVLSYQNNEWVQSDLKDDLPDNPIVDESIRLYEEQLDLAGV